MGFEDEVNVYRTTAGTQDASTADELSRAAAARPQAANFISNALERAVVLLKQTPEAVASQVVMADLDTIWSRPAKKKWFQSPPLPQPAHAELGRCWLLDGYLLDEGARLRHTESVLRTTVERELGSHEPHAYRDESTWGDFVGLCKKLPTNRYPEGSEMILVRSSADIMSVEYTDIIPVVASQIHQHHLGPQFFQLFATDSTPRSHHFAVLADGKASHVQYRAGDDTSDQWMITDLDLWLKQAIIRLIERSRRKRV
ncbi:hypothetical protein HQO42_05280 [Rhodococcus fascians]|nr:hypothetical protein [Rhodococcus fascians]MBY4236583.1 hypothetical protein [Rhodococcus fascians]MBY4252051.1 hypothetical protein [Rhodococcus fascians]MBY4267927.1 hypothetical protein [Rhodococcus fascians]